MNSHEIFVRNKLKEVAKFIKPSSKILDVGSGEGTIRGFLQDCEYWAVDISKQTIDLLKKQNIKAEQVNLNKHEIPFKNEKFDYILLLDILEHTTNPAQILQAARKLLKTAGKMIISLPNDYHFLNKIRFLLNKNLTQDPFSPTGHLHYFPIKSADNFMKNQGFKILKKKYIPAVKPSFIPQKIKNFLSSSFPNNFARDILYIIS